MIDNCKIQKEQAKRWTDSLTKITESFKLDIEFNPSPLNEMSEKPTLNPIPDIISTRTEDVLAFKKYINNHIEAEELQVNNKIKKYQQKLKENIDKATKMAEQNCVRNELGEVVYTKEDIIMEDF